jgi:hypothetical protein
VNLEEKIQTLKSVASLDARLGKLNQELDRQKGAILEKDQKARAASDRKGLLDASVGEMERTRSSLQQELRQLAGQMEKAREKMARCRNERETNAVSREVDELRRIQRERDVEINKLSELIEQAKTERDAMPALGVEETPEASPMAELERERDELLRERLEVTKGLDSILLKRYDAVRAKRGSGIAEVVKGTCMACHIQLSPMIYQQMLNSKELITCSSCLRILYLRPAPSDGG